METAVKNITPESPDRDIYSARFSRSDYNKDIARCAIDLVSHPIKNIIKKYRDDFLVKASNSYLYWKEPGDLYLYCQSIYNSRNILADSASIDFSDANFRDKVTQYLRTIEGFCELMYSMGGNRYPGKCIMSTIFEYDMKEVGENEIRISLSNPMILGALLTVELQVHNPTPYNAENDAEEEIHHEHLLQTIRGYFYGTSFLYNKEFYRIVGFDESNATFVALAEEDAHYEESVPIIDLYSKILDLSQKRDGAGAKVAILGGTENVDTFLELVRKEAPNIEITHIEGRERIEESLEKKAFDSMITSYDEIYILDCPCFYRNTFISEHNKPLKFKNNFDAFAWYYDYAQYYLFGEVHPRFIHRTKLLDSYKLSHIIGGLRSCIKNDICKNISLYVPYEISLGTYPDDVFKNMVSTDKSEVPGFKCLRCGSDVWISESSVDRTISMTYFDLLNVIPPSYDFYCRITGIEDPVEAVRLASSTLIQLTYDEIKVSEAQDLKIDVSAAVKCTYSGSIPKDYKKRVEDTIRIMLKAHYGSHNEESKEDETTFYRESMREVLYEHSRNFDDLLFCCLYSESNRIYRYISTTLTSFSFSKVASIKPTYIKEPAEKFNRHAAFSLTSYYNDDYSDWSLRPHVVAVVDYNNSKEKRYVRVIEGARARLGYYETKRRVRH